MLVLFLLLHEQKKEHKSNNNSFKNLYLLFVLIQKVAKIPIAIGTRTNEWLRPFVRPTHMTLRVMVVTALIELI